MIFNCFQYNKTIQLILIVCFSNKDQGILIQKIKITLVVLERNAKLKNQREDLNKFEVQFKNIVLNSTIGNIIKAFKVSEESFF